MISATEEGMREVIFIVLNRFKCRAVWVTFFTTNKSANLSASYNSCNYEIMPTQFGTNRMRAFSD